MRIVAIEPAISFREVRSIPFRKARRNPSAAPPLRGHNAPRQDDDMLKPIALIFAAAIALSPVVMGGGAAPPPAGSPGSGPGATAARSGRGEAAESEGAGSDPQAPDPRPAPDQTSPRSVPRTGESVSEHPIALDAGGGQRRELRVEVLAGGADPCVAEDRCHTHDRLIAHRQWGFETRRVRQETRHRHLRLRGGGVGAARVVSFLLVLRL